MSLLVLQKATCFAFKEEKCYPCTIRTDYVTCSCRYVNISNGPWISSRFPANITTLTLDWVQTKNLCAKQFTGLENLKYLKIDNSYSIQSIHPNAFQEMRKYHINVLLVNYTPNFMFFIRQ